MSGALEIRNDILGTVYFVDATNGLDTNNGLSPAHAWKTIAKVNGGTFSAGDQILFKRGETWRERLTVPSSGSAGRPIVFGAYGSGNLPKILGSIAKNATGDWTNESGNIWYTANPTNDAKLCVFNNEASWAAEVATQVELTEQGQLWWDNTNHRIYLYSVGNPATFYNGTIETCQLWGGTSQGIISIISKSYIRIENLDLRYVSSYAIYGTDSNYIEIKSCNIKFIGSLLADWWGIGVIFKLTTVNSGTGYYLYNSTISYANRAFQTVAPDSSSILVDINGNTISYCFLGLEPDGVSFASNTSTDVIDYTGSYVRNNDISQCKRGCISLSHASHMIVEHNICHDSYGTDGFPRGIEMGTYGMHNNIVRYNHIYGFGGNPAQWADGVGIFFRNCHDGEVYYNLIHDCIKGIYSERKDATSGGNDNNKIYNNVVYNCEKYGIWVQGVAAGAGTKTITVQNNICHCDHDASDYDICFEQAEGYESINCTGGYNCLVNDAAVTKLAGTTYSGVANDLYATDPLFINGGGSFALDTDFKIPTGSPCKNTGVDVDLTQDYFGGTVPQGAAPDIGAHEFV